MPNLLSESELHAHRLAIQEALDISDQKLIDSLMDHIEAMKEAHGILESELRRQITEQKNVIDALKNDLQRVTTQHDRVALENKHLHQTVDSHLGVRTELERQLARATEHARKHAETCIALRKRNGKLAKKLEMSRI